MTLICNEKETCKAEVSQSQTKQKSPLSEGKRLEELQSEVIDNLSLVVDAFE